MAGLIRSFDWSKSAIGPIESWSPALRMMVGFMLANRFPLLLWWGPTFCSIYNDPYRPVLGVKHPWALGKSVSECWSEIWHVLKPLIETPFNGGPPTWMEDIQLEINRYGFLEETHFTVAYSPVPDETAPRGIGGVLATVHEISEKVVGERRVAALRDLGVRVADAKTAEEACSRAAQTLSAHEKDVPFVLLYLIDAAENVARLAGAFGVAAGEDLSPMTVDLDQPAAGGWPFAEARRSGALVPVELLCGRFKTLPRGPWSDPPHTALVGAIPSARPHEPVGFMVAGASARLKLDDGYRDFFELARSQLATAIGNARAYEEERKRAEALAEIDRAKTAFFSNVSHEFRTPLTLMLGPIEDGLADAASPLPPPHRERQEVARRNGLRLQRLVNTLLDFSRIEAGRAQASYAPTDLARFTAELASNFNTACERAGLGLEVDCPPLPQPVYVDSGMWEKIVLNLLSNAFKFTFEGGIEVVLRENAGSAELTVRDTGIGIAAAELPRLFERFHRVEGARGRTHEGSGIGLAFVQELAHMHGGDIRVASEPSRGSAFTVSVPFGTAHLATERVQVAAGAAPAPSAAGVYVAEAMAWLRGADDADALAHEAADPDTHILVVDDNADMRDYAARLLRRRWRVTTATNGREALERIAAQPFDLVLSDVTMPELDGLALLDAIKSQPATAQLPVVLLSARAGEESRVDGVAAGADDYIVKPFTAQQLLAQVGAQLTIGQVRRKAAVERERLLVREQLAKREAESANRAKDEFLAMLGHELRNPLAPISTAIQLMRLRGADVPELGTLERQVAHLTRLVDDLLDVSRITRGKIELRRRTMEIGDAVLRAMEMAGPLLEPRAHRVSIEGVPRGGLAVSADPDRLAQVVFNLLSNAAKYSEPGSAITVRATREGGQVLVSVRDEGAGIAPDMIDRVFEMFAQQEQTLARSAGGLGLGLTIVRSLVELHGGSVSANSAGLGQGSEFCVSLPAAHAQASAAQAPQPAVVPAAGRGRRILVVDDNADAAMALAELLKMLGHEVQIAHDGPQALNAAPRFQPEVALIDIGLPVMDGYTLAQRLRERCAGDRPLRMVAVTGYGLERDRERSAQTGFTDHLVKPIDMAELDRLLQQDDAGKRSPRAASTGS